MHNRYHVSNLDNSEIVIRFELKGASQVRIGIKRWKRCYRVIRGRKRWDDTRCLLNFGEGWLWAYRLNERGQLDVHGVWQHL